MADFREVFAKSKHIAIITGAGVSAESGVPTFRGAGGFWRKWPAQVRNSNAVYICAVVCLFKMCYLFKMYYFKGSEEI